MSVTHVVAQGEFLSLIAARFGFRDHRVIWDHPDNAALKKLRKNPNVLFPGDVIVIPDRAEGRAAAAVGRFNTFEAGSDDLLLNIDFEDPSARPFASREGQVTVGGIAPSGTFGRKGPLPMSTDPKGRLPLVLKNVLAGSVMPSEGSFVVPETDELPGGTFRFLVGSLDPVDTPSGQRARLNNLGYFAGFSDRDEDQLAWAVEEFQADEKLPDRGLKGTIAKDRKTLNQLARRHGDMLAGEELA